MDSSMNIPRDTEEEGHFFQDFHNMDLLLDAGEEGVHSLQKGFRKKD